MSVGFICGGGLDALKVSESVSTWLFATRLIVSIIRLLYEESDVGGTSESAGAAAI